MRSHLPLLLQAREVDGLAGLPLSSLAAGKTHSAAVLESGEAFTWGEGGDGKLGHGSTGARCRRALAARAWRQGGREAAGAGCSRPLRLCAPLAAAARLAGLLSVP